MFLQNLKVFCFIIEINSQISALVELPQVEDNMLATESVIENVINNLFSLLKLKGVKEESGLPQNSFVHDYLTSVTLQDSTKQEIEKIVSVDMGKVNNETIYRHFNDKIEIEPNDEHVLRQIELFINKLKRYKAKYNINDSNLDINYEVSKRFNREEDLDVNNYTLENIDSVETFDNDTLNENEFWTGSELSGRRIYKGTKTKIKYFPFMASILIFNKFQCSGSIIASDLIITAASCLQLAYNNRFFRENAAFLTVRVGSTYFNSGGEVIAVLEVYFHPGYNPKNLRNNICILRLIRHIKFRRKERKIKKIHFDRHASGLSVMTNGITVLGWGAKRMNNIIRDPRLSYAVLDIYHLGECQNIYSREYVTKNNFCAGFVSIGGGACNHDVGGPGIVKGILSGIISFGSPTCGMKDAPTVFTKVGFYTDWIEDIMDQKVPVSKKRTTLKTSSPIFQTEPPKTTLKIQPFNGKLQHIPLSKEDTVTIRSDGNRLFKTIINSNEIEEYNNVFEDHADLEDNVEKPEKHDLVESIDIREATEATFFKKATVMGPVDVDEYKISNNMSIGPESSIEGEDLTIEIDEPVTEVVAETPDNLEKKLEADIVKLIDNISVESFIKTSATLANDKFLNNIKNNGDVVPTTQKVSKDVNNSGLTLINFSDNEKGDADTVGDIKKDMGVVKTPFKDMRNGSENGLMNLLLEAFKAEFGN